MIKYLVIFILGFTIGAVLHENDIVRVCKQKGHSGYSVWTAKLICEVKETP